jgi:hypothetical protein
MNREERRALKKKIAPQAKEIAALEIMARDPSKKAECEDKIGAIMERMTLMEMMALQDYIMSKGLLEDNFVRDNKNIN